MLCAMCISGQAEDQILIMDGGIDSKSAKSLTDLYIARLIKPNREERPMGEFWYKIQFDRTTVCFITGVTSSTWGRRLDILNETMDLLETFE